MIKEYVEKERLLLLIDDAMFRAKAYNGGLDTETALRILNNLKFMIKTMETINVERGDK